MSIHLGGRGPGHMARVLSGGTVTLTVASLSATNKGPGVTLSNNNLTMAVSTAFSQAALSTITLNGKMCFGATPITANTSCIFGIANINQNLQDYPGDDYTISIGFGWNSGLVLMGGSNNFIATSAAGTENLCAVDTVAKKVWFKINGTWDGDPVAQTGGYAFPSGSGPFYACLACPSGGTFVFDPSPASLPSGYSAVAA